LAILTSVVISLVLVEIRRKLVWNHITPGSFMVNFKRKIQVEDRWLGLRVKLMTVEDY
jgi:hypothetical protein